MQEIQIPDVAWISLGRHKERYFSDQKGSGQTNKDNRTSDEKRLKQNRVTY